MMRLSRRCGSPRPKSAKARSCGKYGTLQGSERYGDRRLVGDVHVRMQVSPEECNGHLGGRTEFLIGW